MYIFPPPIEPNVCTYTLPNFSNILYQSTLPQLDTTLCTYFPLPLNKLVNYTLPNFSNIVYQFNLPQRCSTLCTYFPLPWNQNCLLIPCPTLVILCTNLNYPNLGTTLCTYFPPPIEPKL